MLLLDFFRLYPVTQKFPRKEADIGATRNNTQAKRLITSNPSGSGGHLVIRGASVSSQPLITSVPYLPLQIAQKQNKIK
jgi:hypothetical protein